MKPILAIPMHSEADNNVVIRRPLAHLHAMVLFKCGLK